MTIRTENLKSDAGNKTGSSDCNHIQQQSSMIGKQKSVQNRDWCVFYYLEFLSCNLFMGVSCQMASHDYFLEVYSQVKLRPLWMNIGVYFQCLLKFQVWSGVLTLCTHLFYVYVKI